ncbi:L,D-transpeptidase family protein [Methylobacterium nodulans]|uniref:ErfK/YbiS/YcfS/YnhG family protein n=1 Tax=Methylobacterium nodulans (strain LMG 21967 / CNCM I-2342 / ORS 2060) TaxID=460265 RepID=B8ILE5_METNO|nr:L,D-transpeptidase family protein [Methylobacterium nodulans]ACL60144.1 ErfK/YbiS/YcfS/YnhG family protein [Methylobacterium nodulans ORS 2060]
MLTRGSFSGSLGLALLAAVALPAAAEERGLTQAEWAQNYDSASTMRVQRSNTPILSPQTLAATEQMIERYRDIVARGGWQPVSGAERLRVGARSPAVVALRQRLITSGDLDPAAGSSPVYDSYVEAGVRRFQARHGLNQTGAMNITTVQAMNVPADVRLRQLELNAVRLRSYSGNLGARYVIVNIPAALVETVEGDHVATRHAAGVGKIDRQSPIMNAKIQEVNFNPYWTVPASIIKKDLIPKMQKEPNYLTDNKIRIFDGDREIPPSQVNWRSDEATRYRFRQDPGVDLNSMGFVRINIPNPHGVYMHDTPAKGIFGDDFRFVSSGCVRVQNVRDYVAWILQGTPQGNPETIEAIIQSGQRVDARPVAPIPVYWTYITAWSTPDGLVQFRDDIYKRDGVGAPSAAMAAAAQAPRNFADEDDGQTN